MGNEIEGAEAKPETTNKKKSSKNKRRFSDEQIRLLESIFESETKLEPRKKLEVARELGLQPRQVAIWFQNKRARWKSKQIEQDYSTLKANYDKLASCFHSLNNEKHSLLIQLEKLNKLLGQPSEGNRPCMDLDIIGCGNEGNIKSDPDEAKQGLDRKSGDIGVPANESPQLVIMNNEEYPDGSLASPDQWHSLDSSGGQFDLSMSSISSQWFNLWT